MVFLCCLISRRTFSKICSFMSPGFVILSWSHESYCQKKGVVSPSPALARSHVPRYRSAGISVSLAVGADLAKKALVNTGSVFPSGNSLEDYVSAAVGLSRCC